MAKTESPTSKKSPSNGGSLPRLKEKYRNEVIPKIIKEFSYRNLMQVPRLDAEMSQLFEDYYQSAFGKGLANHTKFHRVIPVNESIKMDLEVQPYEDANQIIDAMQSWGVQDCICRILGYLRVLAELI